MSDHGNAEGDGTVSGAGGDREPRDVVVFTAGAERFAVEVVHVEEVVERVAFARLAGLPAPVAGVARCGERWLPAVEVGARPADADPAPRYGAVVVHREPLRYAVLADGGREIGQRTAAATPRAADGAGESALRVTVDGEPATLHGPDESLHDVLRPDDPVPESSPDEGLAGPAVVFRVGRTEFAIDVMRVHEVVPFETPRPVGGMPEFLAGVVDVRGGMVPALDLRERLATGSGPRGTAPRILLTSVGVERIGLIVDAVRDVVHLSADEVSPPPPPIPSLAPAYVRGFASVRDRAIVLARADRLLPAEQLRALLGTAADDSVSGS